MRNKYRKKPVVIEAVEYDGTGASVMEIKLWAGAIYDQKNDQLYISTLEGDMLVSVGDFVIRGVQGEYYPCRGDIFEQTYEAVE